MCVCVSPRGCQKYTLLEFKKCDDTSIRFLCFSVALAHFSDQKCTSQNIIKAVYHSFQQVEIALAHSCNGLCTLHIVLCRAVLPLKTLVISTSLKESYDVAKNNIIWCI